MDLFNKFKGLEIVNLLKASGIYPFFRKLQGTRGTNVVFNNQELVMMGSNNYLGLTHDPRVMDAAIQAIKRWGTGCTGSRFLNGNLAIHEELEDELASFFGTEAALVFATGFMANQGAIGALIKPGDFIFSDEENHACIIEGCRLTRAEVKVYKHCDLNHLEELLKSVPLDAGKLIITDGVFSMTGDIAPFDKIHELAQKYNARTYVDDAHGLGVIGKGGRGTPAYFNNLMPDVLMGTFSKSLASQGGYICGSNELIEWLRVKSRTFMFSAALAPASTASALKALQILKEEPQRVENVRANATYLKKAFDVIGFDTMGTQTCVIPVFIGSDEGSLVICQELLQRGIFTTPVPYPAVPKGHALIRCSVMATHTREDLDKAIDAFKELAPMVFEANQMSNEETALADNLDDSNPVQLNGLKTGRDVTSSDLL